MEWNTNLLPLDVPPQAGHNGGQQAYLGNRCVPSDIPLILILLCKNQARSPKPRANKHTNQAAQVLTTTKQTIVHQVRASVPETG